MEIGRFANSRLHHPSRPSRSRRAAVYLAFLLLAIVAVVSAQSPTSLLVTYPQAIEENGKLRLNVYFTVVSGDNHAVANANLDRAGAILIEDRGESYAAEVSKAESPIYIALVLDASGSMRDAVGDLRQAALVAVDAAPQQAYLGVFQFNEPGPDGRTLQPLHDFSTDRDAVRQNINRIQTDNKGTCMYYAVDEAVDAIARATQNTPQARRAIILFTDGYDELIAGQRDPCSRNTTVDQVIAKSRSTGPTPIYTIGLGGSNDVDVTTLRRFADETGGLSVAGGQSDMTGHFRQIMEILAEQWLASAIIGAQPGTQQASLTVHYSSFGAESTDLTGKFSFDSPGLFFANDPSVYRASWLDADNRFRLDVTHSQAISRLDILVLKDGGGELETLSIEPGDGGDETFFAAPNLSLLEPGRRYQAQIYVFDKTGAPILRNDDPVLATVDFTYEPPVEEGAKPPAVRIVEVIPDPANKTITISLDTQDTERVDRYRVSLYNETLRIAVPSFTVIPNEGGRLVIDMGALNVEPGLYRASIMPLDEAHQPLLAEEISYPNQVSYAPSRPSLLVRIGASFRQYPWIPILIGVLLLAMVGMLIFNYIRNRQRDPGYIFNLSENEKTPQSHLNPPTELGRDLWDGGNDSYNPYPRQKPRRRPEDFERRTAEPEGSATPYSERQAPRPAPPRPVQPLPKPAPPPERPPVKPQPAPPLGKETQVTPVFGLVEEFVEPAHSSVEPAVTVSVDDSPDGPLKGHSETISQFPFTIGREKAQLNINDPRISRVHLVLSFENGRLYLTDNSSNGSILTDGALKMKRGRPHELQQGITRVSLGLTIISIHYKNTVSDAKSSQNA